MKCFTRMGARKVTLVALLVLIQLLPAGCAPQASPAQLDELSDNFTGTIDFRTDGTSSFSLQGTQEHLGAFTAQGEVTFRPGQEPGALVGDGVAVFTTTRGDKLVGAVSWDASAEDESGNRASSIRFSWRNSIQFSSGASQESTGEFLNPEDRPPGLVVIAIIAILLATLVPAVQKVR